MTQTRPALTLHGKSYKLMAFDLDGTLLGEDGKIHPRNLEALGKVHSMGIPLVVATGRIYPGARLFADQLDPEAPVISMNGAYIAAGGTLIHKVEIPVEQCFEAVDFLSARGVYWHVYLENGLIASELAHGALYYHNLNKTLPPERVLPIDIPENPVKALKSRKDGILKFIVMSEDANMLQQAIPFFTQHNLSITSSWHNNFEVMAPGIHKGFGLSAVCSFLGIQPSECIAFGDNRNDLELLETAGFAVAMENAEREIKAAADMIAPHYTKGGVGAAVEELFGGQLN